MQGAGAISSTVHPRAPFPRGKLDTFPGKHCPQNVRGQQSTETTRESDRIARAAAFLRPTPGGDRRVYVRVVRVVKSNVKERVVPVARRDRTDISEIFGRRFDLPREIARERVARVEHPKERGREEKCICIN